MVTYVPYCTIVEEPVLRFERRYREIPILDSKTGEEIANDAREGDINVYRKIINMSAAYDFYSKAPQTPHDVLDETGQRRRLNNLAEIKEFYASTNPEEVNVIAQKRAEGQSLESAL